MSSTSSTFGQFNENEYRELLNLCTNKEREQLSQLRGEGSQYEGMWSRAVSKLIANIKEMHQTTDMLAKLEGQKSSSTSNFQTRNIALDIDKNQTNLEIAKNDAKQQLQIIAAFAGPEFKNKIGMICEPVRKFLGNQESELLAIHAKGIATSNNKQMEFEQKQKNASDAIMKVPVILLEIKRLQREAELKSKDPSNTNDMMQAQRMCSQARQLIKRISQISDSANELLDKPYSESGGKPDLFDRRLTYLNAAVKAASTIDSEITNTQSQIAHDTNPKNISSLDQAQNEIRRIIKTFNHHNEILDLRKKGMGTPVDPKNELAFNKTLFNAMLRVESFFKTHEHLRPLCHEGLANKFQDLLIKVGFDASPVATKPPMTQQTQQIYDKIKSFDRPMNVSDALAIVDEWKKLGPSEKADFRDAFQADFRSRDNIDPVKRNSDSLIVNNFLTFTRIANKQMNEELRVKNIEQQLNDLPSMRKK